MERAANAAMECGGTSAAAGVTVGRSRRAAMLQPRTLPPRSNCRCAIDTVLGLGCRAQAIRCAIKPPSVPTYCSSHADDGARALGCRCGRMTSSVTPPPPPYLADLTIQTFIIFGGGSSPALQPAGGTRPPKRR